MAEIGYHKTDDGSRFIFAVSDNRSLRILTIPLFASGMREYFKDFSEDGLLQYFWLKIQDWMAQ